MFFRGWFSRLAVGDIYVHRKYPTIIVRVIAVIVGYGFVEYEFIDVPGCILPRNISNFKRNFKRVTA